MALRSIGDGSPTAGDLSTSAVTSASPRLRDNDEAIADLRSRVEVLGGDDDDEAVDVASIATFNMRTWAAVRRNIAIEKAKLAAAQKVIDANNAAVAQVFSGGMPSAEAFSVLNAEKVKQQDKKKETTTKGTDDRATPAAAAPAPPVILSSALSKWDTDYVEDLGQMKSHLHQDGSSILAVSKPPIMRFFRKSPAFTPVERSVLQDEMIAYKPALHYKVVAARAASRVTGPIGGNQRPLGSGSDQPQPAKRPDNTAAPISTTPLPTREKSVASKSMLEALRDMRANRDDRREWEAAVVSLPRTRLPADGMRSPDDARELLGDIEHYRRERDAISHHQAAPEANLLGGSVSSVTTSTAFSSSRLALVSSARLAGGGGLEDSNVPAMLRTNDKRPSSARNASWPTVLSAEHQVAANRTVTTETRRGPIYPMPLQDNGTVFYGELLNEQRTMLADVHELDDVYKNLVSQLGDHMASVKITFHAMMDGRFAGDRDAEKLRKIAEANNLLQHYQQQPQPPPAAISVAAVSGKMGAPPLHASRLPVTLSHHA